MSLRVFYAAGPGNIISAHENWRQHKDDPSQMALTYSGQFADACEALDATAYMVSSNPTRLTVKDGRFTLEHRPKTYLGGGGFYHLAEVLYGLGLLATAVGFRADVAVISSGSTHYFVLCLFRLFGIRVIPVLHNTLWPAGRRSRRWQDRMIGRLDGWFFRWFCSSALGVSAECSRQLTDITLGRPPAFFLVYPQFRPDYFASIPPPPPIDQRPVRIVFAGRVEIDKGVFDILEIAAALDRQLPAAVEWHICGAGSALEDLKAQCKTRGLESIVKIHGWTSPADLRKILGESHLSIVPTRSSFAEGMAKSAIESVLSGRPFVASSVVPALDAFESCSVKVAADDIEGFVTSILELLRNPRQYEALVKACSFSTNPFIDTRCGFAAALQQSITTSVPAATKAAQAGQLRLLFAAGPGNIIEAHKFWRLGAPDPGQMSLTFSGEFESFCEEHGFVGYLVAARSPRNRLVDGRFILEHRPKSTRHGLGFHVGELEYALRLLATALRFRADYVVVQSGTTHHFLLSMFSVLGIKVIPVLHNTLWPAGFRPTSLLKRLTLWADGLCFRWCAHAIICVSPECARQVVQVARHPVRVLEMRPQFDERLFAPVPPPPHARPFRLVFAGRIVREKGVFDLPRDHCGGRSAAARCRGVDPVRGRPGSGAASIDM